MPLQFTSEPATGVADAAHQHIRRHLNHYIRRVPPYTDVFGFLPTRWTRVIFTSDGGLFAHYRMFLAQPYKACSPVLR